jgi:acyl transferase domain-containing protein/acyl carrier protein
MDPLRDDLLAAIKGLQPSESAVPIYSTVKGEVVDGAQLDEKYWVSNLRQPVFFSTAVRKLREDGHDIFIEISAHPLLLPSIQQELQLLEKSVTTLASMRREEDEQLVMLESLGALYTQGYPIDWRRLYPHGGKFVRLPNYPWQRERHWLEERLRPASEKTYGSGAGTAKSEGRGAKSERRSSSSHPLLGAHFQSASDGTHFWEIELNADDLTYLEDHRVNGMIVVPAAAYAEMALAAMKEIFGDDRHVLEKLEFTEALFVSKDPAQEVQLVLSVEMTGVASFQILSRKAGNKDQSAAWTLHAKGTMRVAQLASNGAAHEQNEIEKHPPSDAAVTSGAEHYQAMSKRGLQYGPSFQGVAEHWQKNGELVSRLQIHEAIASDAGAYQVHPALLDACFQLVVASLPGEDGEVQARATYLPVSLESLQLHERPNLANGLWARVLKKSNGAIDAATISGEVLLLDESGRILLEACGLTLQRVERDRTQELNDWFYRVEWHAKKREPSSQSSKISRWLIFADQRGAGEQLVTALKARGETCIVVTHGNAYNQRSEERFEINPSRSEDFTRLTAEVFKDAPSSHYGVIHLWSLDGISTPQSALTAVESAQELGCGSVLLLMQAFVQANLSERTRLWLLTGGVQVIAEAPANWSVAQAPLWGLGAVLANEHPECKCTRIDLSVMPDAVEIRALSEELLSPVHEDQIALCGDRRFVARLKKWTPEENEENASHSSEAEKKIPAQPEQAYHLEIAKPGILDNLTLRATTRRAAAPGEVEIQVKAAGLNFLDVMKAMGVCPGFDPAVPPALGGECAGIITAVGDGVKGFQIGDEVVAITPSFKDTSMFSAYVTVPALLVLHKPAPLSFDEAATYPIAFLTAFYALHHLGRMSEGERVLIHSATGGVGLAAIQLAQHAGAEIFATAGSPEKRAWLKSLGVQHVFDSRSLSFADEIMRVTSGESEERKAKSEERGAKKEDRSTLHALRSTEPGVDLVLNSLTGAAINKNLEILKPYGRFLEIGKRDIYENSRVGLEPFRKNLSYFAIDLARAIEERPKLISSLFREITQRFAEGVFKPLAYKAYPISNAVSAFRDMAQAKHIGKIVLTMQEKEVLVAPTVETRKVFRADGNYLITGGLGGLGLTFAQWMVEQGARHLVLAGRSGASDEAKGAIEAMEKAGAKITVAKADVAKPEQVANVLAQIKKSMLPLKGIIHAAGILADGTLAQIDRERFYAAMPPKIDGAWNLHLQTLDEPLDFFILFSSVASVLGTTGQGNYAAGNAFLDALAQHRRAAGRPAMSINWGPWSKVGLAAAQANRGERLESRGLGSISPEQGLQAFDLILRSSPAEAVVMPFNFAQWREYHPAARHASLFAEFAIEQKSEEAPASTARAKRATIKEQVLALDSGRQRRAVLETHLQEQAAQVLKLAPSRIPLAKPLKSIGLDSLMALELRNRFEASLGLTLPATMIFNYPTITALASHLAGKLEISLEDVEKLKPVSKLSVGGNGDELDHVLEEIEQLSEDEARKILTE